MVYLMILTLFLSSLFVGAALGVLQRIRKKRRVQRAREVPLLEARERIDLLEKQLGETKELALRAFYEEELQVAKNQLARAHHQKRSAS